MNSSLQDVHNTSRNQKLSTRFQKNLFSVKNISSITPRAYTPKAHAVQALQRCGVGKDLQRLLVDHNYQIEQGEIQQRSNNTTYSVLTTNRDQVIARNLLPTNVSSFLYFLAGTLRRSSSFTFAPEIRLFRRVLESRSTAIGCAMIPPPPELELETLAISLSGVVEWSAPTFHSRSFFIARFASKCWFPTSFPSCNLTINQPRHKIHRVVELSVPFQCLRTSLYRPGLDRANSGADKMFVGPCRSAQPDAKVPR